MLLIAAILGIGLMLGLGLGGGVRPFGEVRIRLWPLALIGLALQGVPVPRLEGELGRWLPAATLVFSYVLLLGVSVANWRSRGFLLIFLGIALNVAVITVNRGMPVSSDAIRHAGGSEEDIADVPRELGEKHHLRSEGDRLVPLADVIGVAPPFRVVVSVGDVIAYVGAAVFLASVTLSRQYRWPPGSTRETSHRVPSPTGWGTRR